MAENNPERMATTNIEVKLGFNPLFFEAMRVQEKYAHTKVTAEEAALFWNDNQDIKLLNHSASSEALTTEQVALTGNGILIPEVTHSIPSNTTTIRMVEPSTLDDGSLEHSLEEQLTRGRFKGFGVRFESTLEADVYTPVLTYKVDVGKKVSPQATVEGFASGDVGITSLQFDKDTFMDARDEIVKDLAMTAPFLREKIYHLASSLEHTPMDAKVLSYAAWKSNEIANEVDDDIRKSVEDMLADIVALYVKKNQTSTLKTAVYVVPEKMSDSGVRNYRLVHSVPKIFKHRVDSVMFLEKYELTERGTRSFGERTMYLVFIQEEDDFIAYVPIHELQEYSNS